MSVGFFGSHPVSCGLLLRGGFVGLQLMSGGILLPGGFVRRYHVPGWLLLPGRFIELHALSGRRLLPRGGGQSDQLRRRNLQLQRGEREFERMPDMSRGLLLRGGFVGL